MSASATTITVFSRAGCHLCAEAERIVADVAAGRAEVEVVDIDGDPDLVARYTVRVPVVAIDGVEVAELMIDRADLERALRERALP